MRGFGFRGAEKCALEQNINGAPEPANAGVISFGRIEPFDEMASVPRRERFEGMTCLRMLL